ncbi:MAG: hypothetical protein ABIT04_09070 [Novosphingobium sp.]
MTRWFLTLLALLAGVSAHLAPSQARVGPIGASEINLVEALADDNGAVVSKPVSIRPDATERAEDKPPALTPAAPPAPTVLFGADRARE